MREREMKEYVYAEAYEGLEAMSATGGKCLLIVSLKSNEVKPRDSRAIRPLHEELKRKEKNLDVKAVKCVVFFLLESRLSTSPARYN